MKEAALEALLNTATKQAGAVLYKLDASARRGAPDRVVLSKGSVTFVELKADDGRVAPIQAYEHARIRAAGGAVVVLRGADEVRGFCETL